MLNLFLLLASVVLIDLVLSGDNALINGATAAKFPKHQRRLLMLIGGGASVLFRILLTIVATILLKLPFVHAIGGIILFGISIRLIINQYSQKRNNKNEIKQKGFWPSIVMIISADAIMSLDNVLAVGSLVNGQIIILIFGLLFSITILFIASALIAELIGRFPILFSIASLVIALTGINMVVEGTQLNGIVLNYPVVHFMCQVGILIIVGFINFFLYRIYSKK